MKESLIEKKEERNMTEEQKQTLIETGQYFYESFKPFIELLNNVLEQIKEDMKKIIEWVKSILETKLIIYMKVKKGNRYIITKREEIPIYQYLQRIKM